MKLTDTPPGGLIPVGSNRLACWIFMLCVALVSGASLVSPARAAGSMVEPELLQAEKAFSVTARRVNDRTLELRYTIADGYYMYRDRFRFSIDGQPVLLSRHAWPPGKWKQDATFGKVITYRDSVRLLLPVPPAALDSMQSGRKSLTLLASSQGCADAGVCYPPLGQTLVLMRESSAWVTPLDELTPGFSHGGRPGGGLADRLIDGR